MDADKENTNATPSHSHEYDRVTARILGSLEAGTIPWRKPWHETAAAPASAFTGKPYRGVNVLLLGMAPFGDHRWLTFRQCQELGGKVRKGERSTEIVFWKPVASRPKDGEPEEEKARTIPILKTYRVFNAEQCDSLALPDVSLQAADRLRERIPRAETAVRAMPEPPRIREGQRAAWYAPAEDLVGVPGIGAFATPDAYYATLFHEIVHATGHPKRLARPGICERSRYGSCDYSREELVAELASAFLCAAIGLDNSLLENSAAYVAGWLKALGDDRKAVVAAAGQAQRATEWVFGRTL